MKHSMLTRLVVGFALTAAVASVNCGGDDTNGTPGTGGSTGTGGGTGGSTGTGGGTGGSTGTGGSAGVDGGTGGTTGTGGARPEGGTGGAAGSTGTGGVRDGGGDGDAGGVTFAAVKQILQDHCVACHGGPPPQGNPNLINFTDTTNEAGLTLYQRLTSPLPTNQEGRCFFNPASDGGDTEAGASDAEASVRANRTPIIANSLGNSFLYQKVNGGFEGQGAPNVQLPDGGGPNFEASGCGVRMPRVVNGPYDASVPDAGLPATLACDAPALDAGTTNCLAPNLIAQIAAWIQAGALNN